MNAAIQAGVERTDALKALADRTELDDIRGLVSLLCQSVRFGPGRARGDPRVKDDELRGFRAAVPQRGEAPRRYAGAGSDRGVKTMTMHFGIFRGAVLMAAIGMGGCATLFEPAATTEAQDDTKQAELAMTRAEAALRQGDLDRALFEYVNVLSLEEAKAYLEKALTADEHRWRAHNGLGVIADLNHDYAAAEQHYQAALRERPETPDVAHQSRLLEVRGRGLGGRPVLTSSAPWRSIHGTRRPGRISGSCTCARAAMTRPWMPSPASCPNRAPRTASDTSA